MQSTIELALWKGRGFGYIDQPHRVIFYFTNHEEKTFTFNDNISILISDGCVCLCEGKRIRTGVPLVNVNYWFVEYDFEDE